MNNVLETAKLSDSELVASCRDGDQDAWAELVHRYQRLIYSVARKFCSEPEDCADVFQRVCIELYKGLNRLRNDQTLPAWLITVTKRMSYEVLRNGKQTIPIDDMEMAAESGVRAVEEEFALERAVESLPDRCKKLIEMLYFDAQEPTYEAISKRLGMPESSIGPTRARCLEKLKKNLES